MHYKRAFIYENDDFINNWHNAEYFKDYLEINDNEKYDFSAVYNNQAEDVHPPIYYLLLRIACSFNINNFSIWPGTILNIILFIFSSIMLYLIGKKVFENDYYGLLLCLLNGFSIATIETVMYIRMYQLFILNVLILIYWHLIKQDKSTLNFKNDYSLLYIMIILGFLTHYYYAFFAAILYVMYLIRFIKNKKYESALKYTVTYICSVITSIIVYPHCIKHLLFSYRGQEVISNSSNLFSKLFINYLIENINIINSEFFNGNMIIVILLIIILMFIILIKYKNNKVGIKNDKIKYITIPLIFYFLISVLVSPYCDLRYLMPIIPLVYCLILYAIYDLLYSLFNKKHTFYIIFVIVIVFIITCIPKFSNNTYTNKGYNDVVNYIRENLSNKPLIYIYSDISAKYNKTMEIYQSLITFDETYILPDTELDSNKISEALNNKDISNGIVLVINNFDTDKTVQEVMNTGLFKENKFIFKIARWDFVIFK